MARTKIIVFNPFGIGDVLFTTPLLRNLKDRFPQSNITYLCNRRCEGLMRANCLVDDVVVFEKDQWRETLKSSKIAFIRQCLGLYKSIRRARYDILFDLSMNSQYGFFFKLAGIPIRIGYNYRGRGRFLTHSTDLPKGFHDRHVARYHLGLLRHIDYEGRDYPYDACLNNEQILQAREKLKSCGIDFSRPLIGVCPGAGDSWQDTAGYKQWPRECYLALLKKIIDECPVDVVLFGSVSEQPICQAIVEGLDKRVVANMCGKAGLMEFFACLSLCDLVVTNDGGPFHASQAVAKRSIVFFGPVDTSVYGPYPDDKLTTIFSADVECRPCYRSFRFEGCEFNKRCLNEISPDEVFASLKESLDEAIPRFYEKK